MSDEGTKDPWFDGDFVEYLIEDMETSPNEILLNIGKGLADMHRDVEFKGGFMFRLAVEADVAEVVEEAARRGGVRLTKAPEE